ncbi:MAG: single-stranded-DNA-specific exonuclease RecJ [Oscillospiraceae bacterium]|nr:single-stranded-DNA-specific exonuclease RecJ [Oscillospiraceae bacterium]
MKAQLWKVNQPQNEAAAAMRSALSIPELAAMVSAARGNGLSDTKALIDSTLDALCDPWQMADMQKAVQTIQDSIENEELICVFGDYDCDGVAATAMMKSYLESVGARSCYYIPHREKEGYGLNNAAIADLSRMGVRLIITVDNGVSAIEEIEYANSLGMRVVVTDHHQPKDILPDAAAVVNPHRSDCPYPFKDLAGVGVAFKLLCAMEGENGEELLEQYGDLLAIGTVADIVSLTGENRCFVKRGLELMSDSYRVGIRALLASAGLEGKKLNSDSVAFGIAPRINAAGRLDSAENAVMLLLTEDESEAAEIVSQMESFNSSRKSEEKKITDDIAQQLKNDPNLLNRRILSFCGEGWNAGVVGIVCSRLVDRFGKPCLLIAINGDEAKGSGRSVEGYSLIGAITACSEKLTRYGGHPMAAGFSLMKDDVSEFLHSLEQFSAENYPVMPAVTLKIDCEVEPALLNVAEIKGLDILEPFGSANPSPVFMVSGAVVDKIIPLSEGKHIKLRLAKDKTLFEVVCFFVRPVGFCVSVGDLVDVAFSASINEYHGQVSPSLKFKAIRLSNSDMNELVLGRQRFESYLRGENRSPELIPTRDEVAVVYRYLKGLNQTFYSLDAVFCHILQNKPLDYVKFRIAIDVMLELGLISRELRQEGELIAVNPSAAKVDLQNSSVIRGLQQQL